MPYVYYINSFERCFLYEFMNLPLTNIIFVFQSKTYDSVTDKFMDFSFEKVGFYPVISKCHTCIYFA